MWRKGNPHVLLVGMQTSAANKENSMEISQKLTNRTTIWPSWDFLGGAMVKNPPANAEGAKDTGSISGSGISPRVRKSNLLQYSCLDNSMDRGTWPGYSPWGRKEPDMTEQLSMTQLSHFWIFIQRK